MKKILFILFVTGLLFSESVNAQGSDKVIVVAEPEISKISTERYFVRFKQGKRKQKIAKFKKDFRFVSEEQLGKDEDWSLVKIAKGKVDEVLKEWGNDKDIQNIEPDAVANVVMVPSDPSFSAYQWPLENSGQIINGVTGKVDADMDVSTAWDKVNGEGVKVAVLDTGIDKDHADLRGVVLINKNFSTSTSDDDLYGHGTHVGGIIAANFGNNLGIAGACRGCSLFNVKVLGDDGSGYYSAIINGIYFATDNGAKVINMSLGGTVSSTAMEQAINYAWSKGVVVVAAAGNSNSSKKFYPAAYKNVIAVAATNNKDQKSSFSNYSNSWIGVAAPGEAIFSTLPNHPNYLKSTYGLPNEFGWLSGTSMAAPFVAAEAALLVKKYGNFGNSWVRFKIERSTDLISGTGMYWKYGRVNFDKAVR